MFELRPYQREGIDRIRQVWDLGYRRALLVNATGLGKTVTFVRLAHEVLAEHGPESKALILAHRNELLEQARSKYLAVDPDELVGIYQGKRRETWARVICASVQSCYPDKLDDEGNVTRRGRLRDLPLANIKLVVVDECHHAIAPTYLAIIEAIFEASPDAVMLGVTATPYRTDGRGLGELWSCTLDDVLAGKERAQDSPGVLASRIGIEDGIAMGYLVPFSPRSRRFALDVVDLSAVKVSRATKDFVEASLSEVMDTDGVRDEVVTRWLEHAGPGAVAAPPEGRQTVAFCSGVAASEHLAEAFEAVGVPAAALSGKTKKDERARIIAAYQSGETRVLCNCQVLTEGWDAPATSCVVVVRPTKSLSMFVQMVGRGTRLLGADIEASRANGKPDCLLLDFGGASDGGVIGQPDLARADYAPGIDPTEDERMADATPEEVEAMLDLGFAEPPKRTVVQGVCEYTIDVFAGGRVQWAIIEGCRVCVATVGLCVMIYPDRDTRGLTYSALAMRGRQYRMLATATTEADALAAATRFAVTFGDPKFLKPDGYAARVASVKQRSMLRASVEANSLMDDRLGRGAGERVKLAGLPKRPDGSVHYERVSMALASLWISYLHVRAALGTRIATRVDTLFDHGDRCARVARLVGATDGGR